MAGCDGSEMAKLRIRIDSGKAYFYIAHTKCYEWRLTPSGYDMLSLPPPLSLITSPTM